MPLSTVDTDFYTINNTYFTSVFDSYSWNTISNLILLKTESDVEKSLLKPLGHSTLDDFMAMISPSGAKYIEELAKKSHEITCSRFGKTIQLYIPLYLSNECQNICTYCGFSLSNKIKRKTLSDSEIIKEVKKIKSFGFDNVLLVTGEANKTAGVDYIENAVKLIRPFFSQVSVEVQPMQEADYIRLIDAGVYSVLVYQETYYQKGYKVYHPKGRKSDFYYRLQTPDRLGISEVHKIGLGCLIGLEDWRTDSWFTALHLHYLQKKYWQTKYSVSFPRLRPAEGFHNPKSIMADKELVQLICAFRIFNPDVELSLSTRESEHFRNNVVRLGITSMSAGSKTSPGGYSNDEKSLSQFEISDERSPQLIYEMIKEQGYDPVWKDWFNG